MSRHQPLATLRHVSASGRLDMWWELLPKAFQPARILASIKIGSLIPFEVDLPVCSERNKVNGSFILLRIDEATFQLTPVRWIGNGVLAHGEAFWEGGPVGTIDLTHAPPKVQREFAEM